VSRRLTILEILVSLVVLSVGVLGILSLLPASVASAERTTNKRLATELGAALLGELRLAASAPHVEWHPAEEGAARRPKVVNLVLRREGLEPVTLSLPHGHDRWLEYPEARLGESHSTFPAVGPAQEALPLDGGTLPPPSFSFRLKLARAYSGGERVNGLYDVSVLVYQGLEPAADAQPKAALTTQIMSGPLDLPTLGRP